MSDAAPRPDATSVVFECDLDERPETVWRALTTPEIVAEWLGPNTMTQDPSEPFEVKLVPEEGGVVACEILEASPSERLSYAWRVRDEGRSRLVEMEVTFTLTPTQQGGTHLRIVHSGPALSGLSRQGSSFMLSVAQGTHERRPLHLRRRLLDPPASHMHRAVTRRPARLRQAA